MPSDGEVAGPGRRRTWWEQGRDRASGHRDGTQEPREGLGWGAETEPGTEGRSSEKEAGRERMEG